MTDETKSEETISIHRVPWQCSRWVSSILGSFIRWHSFASPDYAIDKVKNSLGASASAIFTVRFGCRPHLQFNVNSIHCCYLRNVEGLARFFVGAEPAALCCRKVLV